MITVWKYPIPHDVGFISMPKGAEVLHVGLQAGISGVSPKYVPCVWARVDTNRRQCRRRVTIVGTGHPASEDAKYAGTFFLHGGDLVLHVFIENEEQEI
jgi:hypothetical protein